MSQTVNHETSSGSRGFLSWVRRILSVLYIPGALMSVLAYFFIIYEESERLKPDSWWFAAHASVAAALSISIIASGVLLWGLRARNTSSGSRGFLSWVRRILSVLYIPGALMSVLAYFFIIYEESERLKPDSWWFAAHASVAAALSISIIASGVLLWGLRAQSANEQALGDG